MKKELFAAVLAGSILLAGCAKAAPPATVTTIGTSSPYRQTHGNRPQHHRPQRTCADGGIHPHLR